jgi:hypothetical protein
MPEDEPKGKNLTLDCTLKIDPIQTFFREKRIWWGWLGLDLRLNLTISLHQRKPHAPSETAVVDGFLVQSWQLSLDHDSYSGQNLLGAKTTSLSKLVI